MTDRKLIVETNKITKIRLECSIRCGVILTVREDNGDLQMDLDWQDVAGPRMFVSTTDAIAFAEALIKMAKQLEDE